MRQKTAYIIILISLIVIGLVVYGSIRMKAPEARPTRSPASETPVGEVAASTPPASPEPLEVSKPPESSQPQEATQPQDTSTPENAPTPQATPKPPVSQEEFLKQVDEMKETVPPTVDTGTPSPVDTDNALLPAIQIEPAGDIIVEVDSTDKPILKEFKVHNKGKGDLKITSVNSQCGCTKGKLRDEKSTVPPGDFAVIDITVNPQAIHGFESRKYIKIVSNDPNNKQVTVNVISRVDPEFEIEPVPLDFGTVEKGEINEAQLHFRQLKGDPIEILKTTSGNPRARLEARFEKIPEAEWKTPGLVEYLITVRIPKDFGPGPFNGLLTIQSTCKRMKIYQVNVKATVTSFYTVSAQQLLVRAPIAGRNIPPAKAEIRADQPFEILNLKSSTPDVQLTTNPGVKPNSVVIEAALNPEAKSGRRSNETITFTIKSGDKTLDHTIPVTVSAIRTPRPPVKAPRPPVPAPAVKPPSPPAPAPVVKPPSPPVKAQP